MLSYYCFPEGCKHVFTHTLSHKRSLSLSLSVHLSCYISLSRDLLSQANRFLSFPYMSSAVKFQLLIEEWIHLFATTWGRAALYLFEALLLVTYGGWLDWLGFAYMTVLAIFAMLLAMSAGKKLDSIKSVMKDMSRGVNMNDIAFVESKFDEWDTDKNGSISIHELRDVAIACGSPMSVAETEVAYNILDADRSGTITKREFLIWWKTQSTTWA